MARSRQPRPRSRRYAAVIVLAGGLAYANSCSGPFVFDDRGAIVDNPTIERLSDAAVLSAPPETPTAGRPVVNVSFALNYAAGGREVAGYHAVNIVIHLVCGLLIFGLVRRSIESTGAGFAAALLWTVHPLNTEAVDYITQRTESLMALFYLLTLYAAVRAHVVRGAAPAGRPERPTTRWRWEACAIAACALGMASKESMATAPLIVLLYDRVFLFGSFADTWRARRRLYVGLAADWIGLAVVMWTAPRTWSAGFTAYDADAWTYLLNQAQMVVHYLRLATWPRGLTLYYGWPLPLTLTDVVAQAALMLALIAATVIALKRWPKIGFLGAWFFITLAPTSSIIPIATEVGAERRMYLPLAAVLVLAVVAWLRLAAPVATRAAWIHAAALAAIASLLVAGTRARNREYASSLRLAETTLEQWPTDAAHSMVGTELAAAGRLSEAELHLRAAAPAFPPARYYLATVLAATGRRAEAIAQFRAFIGSQPGELDQVVLARALLGDTLMREGRPDEAAAEYRAVLDARPDNAQAMRQLATICLAQRRVDEAIVLYRRALRTAPNDLQTLGGLGIALASTGRLAEAVEVLQRASDLDPQNVQAARNLARAMAMRDAGSR